MKYLGETDNVVTYIANADCIVLPSYREGISRILLEASAMARPIVATISGLLWLRPAAGLTGSFLA